MKKEIVLPRDELPHESQAIEWWYFNGFIEGKSKYAFMTTLFRADIKKSNLQFLKIPLKTAYFSHTLLYNLSSGEIKKEILPIVIPSEDSFSRKELMIDYFYPLKKSFANYEISRLSGNLRLKTPFFDLILKQKKKPLLEGGTGHLVFGNKATYYYSYPHLQASGWVGNEKVRGRAWHDRQWSQSGFSRDSWVWFCFQLPDNTQIVCFEYKGKKLATISYPDNKQKSFLDIFIKPLKTRWKSAKTGASYSLSWEIKIPGFRIKTSPIIKDCEISSSGIRYWEGPVSAKINSFAVTGFMELLPKQAGSGGILSSLIEKEQFLKNLIYTG